MYKIEDYAQYYAMTNKENPVPMDVSSGDGKTVSFHCGEEFRNRTGNWWGSLVEHFERPDFIAALYDYLNTVDLSGYDFKVERQRILTDSYRRLIEANIPFVARSLVDLLRKMLTESCEVTEFGDIMFFQNPERREIKEPPSGNLKVKRSDMFDLYQIYAEKVKKKFPHGAHSYYKQLRELKLDITDITVNNCNGFGFNLRELYQECIQRGYENGDFAVGGFQKRDEIVDTRRFDLSEFE